MSVGGGSEASFHSRSGRCSSSSCLRIARVFDYRAAFPERCVSALHSHLRWKGVFFRGTTWNTIHPLPNLTTRSPAPMTRLWSRLVLRHILLCLGSHVLHSAQILCPQVWWHLVRIEFKGLALLRIRAWEVIRPSAGASCPNKQCKTY